jgi:poly(3-hydroxybutyrate) depolymerase
VTDRDINSETISIAWERLFSETRRWQNDTYGCYQKRTNFTEKGFTAHVKDSSLGCNKGHPQTWYEYIPPQLRGTSDKVPLLFNFHGGGCVPLYAAEQSDWHEIANKENFIVVYPEASQRNMWNAWDDRNGLEFSDVDFFLALIEHMKSVHPIDETRIYVSGFSMGAMMSNALACAFPDVIAAAAPCNAFNEGYFSSLEAMEARRTGASYASNAPMDVQEASNIRKIADKKKAAFDYIVPVIQTAGLIDGKWPIVSTDDMRLKTFDYWRNYNHLGTQPLLQNADNESGLTADETFYDGDDKRFLRHRWLNSDEESLYELLLAKRCPHALDIRTHSYTWQFLKRFSRNPDGTLNINK